MALRPLPTFPPSAYGPISPRAKAVKRKRADRRGWPACDRTRISEYQAHRVTFRLADDYAPLAVFLVKASNALGYDIRRASEPDGGVGSFYCRNIKNSRPPQPSVHAIGCAIDQNTRGNRRNTPNRVRPLKSVTPPEIVELWESSGHAWGGRFGADWLDPMHFEYLFPPSEVAADLVRAKAAFKRLNGGSDELYPTLQRGAKNAAMGRVLQYRLNEHGASIDEDGDFGDATDAAVRQFQADNGLVVDSIVGSITWGALNGDAMPDEEEPEPEEPDEPDPPAEPEQPQLDPRDARIAELEAYVEDVVSRGQSVKKTEDPQ